ncbi:MAG TPA: TolC family protein [Bryobacteraceae bacterium]|nr:TolC family protein [Bryobacteraceae bacterium]
MNPYRPRPVAPVSLENSSRIERLMRGGQLYLSLDDAIALALENNLDVELQRLSPSIADTDILRARGGGLLRGISLTSAQPPAGVGGPASPLLNSATPGFTVSSSISANTTGTAFLTTGQSSLSITQGTLSNGPALPVFDPTLVGTLNWQHQSTPQSNPFTTGADVLIAKGLTSNVGLVQGFSPGTQISANFSGLSQENNSLRSTLNPYKTSSLGLTLTQPLLRGFGSEINRRYIRIAQNNRKVTDLVFRQQVIDTVSGIIRLYYDLVSLNEDVGVKRQTMELAKKLYEDNKAQVEQGTLAPIELVRAQALISASQQDLANSEGLEREQELIVKNVLTRRGTADPAIREAHVIPTTPMPAPAAEPVQPVQDLLALAFKNRPDLASAGLQLTNTQIALAGSRNNLRPDLNLVASATNSGLAGQPNPLGTTTPSQAFIGGFGGTLEQIFRRNYPTYGVGIQLNLPLRNRVAQADYVRDELQYRQTQIQRQQLENRARLEVEDALISLERSRAAYAAAVDTTHYQEQSLAAEQEKFAVGLSTTFLIIQYQSQLAQARSTEVAARGAYAKARAVLDRALGLTLDRNSVSLDDAFRGQVTRPPSTLPQP